MRLLDVIDILLVAWILYQFYNLLKGTIALRIFIGFLAIYGFYLIVKALEMQLLSSILSSFIGVGVLAGIILFQQEIKKFLILLTRTAFSENKTFLSFFSFKKEHEQENFDLNTIVETAKVFGSTNTGALIIFSRNSNMKQYSETGDEIDAVLSKRLLISIFNKTSPLHDGAVIVYNNRIVAARCILPVSEDSDLPAYFGLRHRAAIGITEVDDCLVLVVSEETGVISVSQNARLYYNLSPLELRNKIHHYFTDVDLSNEEKDNSIKFSTES